MSTSSNVSLGSLRLQAQQRADLENNPAVSTSEWNTYATQSYKELTDLLVAAYGNDYYLANTYQFFTSNAQFYPLPDGTPNFTDTTGSTASKFYKLLGVDLQYSASPSGFVSLRRLEFIERNKYAYPNTAVNFVGYTNLRYRVEGNNLFIVPIPMNGQAVRLWYIPAPTSLQFNLPTNVTVLSPNITLTDTTGLTVGMNVSCEGVVQPNTVITSLGSTSAILSLPVQSTNPSAILSYWNDSTTLDGIAGWEEYIVIDMAIKAQIKQENDVAPLIMQKNDMMKRIEAMATGRDSGQAMHTSDALGMNGYGGEGSDGGWGVGGNGWY